MLDVSSKRTMTLLKVMMKKWLSGKDEIPELESLCEKLSRNSVFTSSRDITEDRDAIVEIRAGTGGDEASLFAGDLYRMYQRFSELRGWKIELLEASPSEVGGFKEVTVKVKGEEVLRILKYESGGTEFKESRN